MHIGSPEKQMSPDLKLSKKRSAEQKMTGNNAAVKLREKIVGSRSGNNVWMGGQVA